jgi:uncharacterized protein YndB with AHSA1/START domain
MTAATETTVTTQTYRVFVNATPEAIWEAITTSEWSQRYGYGGSVEYELHEGGSYRALATEEMRAFGMPEVMIDGSVLDADAPRRLVQTWHALFDDAIAAEPPTRVTWEIEPVENPAGAPIETTVTRLTLTHEVEGAPLTAAIVSGSVPEAGGGWAFVVSDLKTLLETGTALAA